MNKDSLGDRMKADYENRTRNLLPRRTYTLVRVDGKSFHSYTRDCERPYDLGLMEDMDTTAKALCENITGAQFAFVQSDEISVLLTDFTTMQTQAWFDGSVQKLASLSASIATAHFNVARMQRLAKQETEIQSGSEGLYMAFQGKLACFDSRAFSIPDPIEVENYFIWRQQDATRNSISMTAQAHFPHERLQGKSTDQMQEMLWQEKGLNWSDLPGGFKRGRCVIQSRRVKNAEYLDKRSGDILTATGVERRVWEAAIPPVFTKERDWLRERIPLHTSE
ncbi:MAG: tRNA(His) guanylyltransferase Thg1 family protein [Janthinobacterium lividum]